MVGFVKVYKDKDSGALISDQDTAMEIKNVEDTSLVYAETTKVLYYFDFQVMAPYINENGKYCRLINNQIVEIG